MSRNSHWKGQSPWKEQKSTDSGCELSEASFDDGQERHQAHHEDSPLASLTRLSSVDVDFKDLPTDSSSVQEAICVIEELSNSDKTDMVLTQQDGEARDWIRLIAQNQATIIELKQELETVQQKKEEVKKESVFAMQQHETNISSKCNEIKRLKDQLRRYKQCISSLAKNNEEQRKKYEADIKDMKEKLQVEEKEIEGSEIEILGRMKTVLQIRGEEERLRRRLAEANLSMSRVENALRKIERDAAMAEYQSVKAEFERRNPSMTASISTSGPSCH